jgi:hypothetical protein
VPRTLYLGAVNGNLLCCPKRGKASRRDFHQSLRLSPFLWLRWLALILFDFARHLTRVARASWKWRQTGSTIPRKSLRATPAVSASASADWRVQKTDVFRGIRKKRTERNVLTAFDGGKRVSPRQFCWKPNSLIPGARDSAIRIPSSTFTWASLFFSPSAVQCPCQSLPRESGEPLSPRRPGRARHSL